MTLIKTSALLLSTLWLATSPVAASTIGPAVPAAASVVLTFKGMKTPSGRIMGALFDSEAAYAGQGAPVRGIALTVEASEVATTLTGLKPGRYAVRAFHDLDGDGKLSMNPFGTPSEPFAFSNGAKGVMGPAAWNEAAFEIGAGGAAQIITID